MQSEMKKNVLFVKGLIIIIVALIFSVADQLILYFNGCKYCQCLLDTTCHALIGGFIWISIIYFEFVKDSFIDTTKQFKASKSHVELFLALVCGSFIDIDHFIAARSFSLNSATHLERRPFAHSLVFCLLVTAVLCLMRKERLALLQFNSHFSHLLRDSVRRGLWLWPFGSTGALSFPVVMCTYCVLSVLGSACLPSKKPCKPAGHAENALGEIETRSYGYIVAPISRNSISFLHSISIGCIINVSGKKLDGPLSSYCEEQGILVKTLFLDGEDTVLLSSIPRFNEWIAETLGVVIFQCGHTNTLLMGSTDTYYDCLLVACLRKFQQWSFVSILSEFRQQVWPHRLFDFEQLIDHFDRNLVDITSSTPDYLLTHNSLEKEEEKMKERLRVIDEQAGVDGAQLDPEQEKVDRLLNGLFFSGGNQLLSVGIEFDSQLSLINDKDEED